MQNSIDAMATLLMDGSIVILISLLRFRSLPDSVDHICIVKLFEDTITGYNDEIVVISDFEAFDVWCWYDYFWIASIFRFFSFNVSNRS